LGELGANILAVEHRRLFLDVPAKGTRLDVSMETHDQAHAEEIFQVLEAAGFSPIWIDTGIAIE
jgi:threonine dehydratase